MNVSAAKQPEEHVPGLVMKAGPEALRPYAGKWVAIVDGEVRASGASYSEVAAAADAAGLADPLYFRVPAGYVVGGAATTR